MKCIALLPCEKLIIGKDGAHSIINVMTSSKVELRLQTQAGQPVQHKNIPVPSITVMPMHWFIYTLWNPSAEDVGKSFEQVYQLYWPSGEMVGEPSRLRFQQKDDLLHQVNFSIFGFPIGQVGRIRIVSWLDSEGQRASEVVETYVQVAHDGISAETPTIPPQITAK
jgi:hypothetical protein